MPKILITLTSQERIPSTDAPTGWYLPELAHPHEIMTESTALTIASPQGGHAPLDPNSIQTSKAAGDTAAGMFLAMKKEVWGTTLPLSEIVGNEKEFDGVFFVGGHGPMFDLTSNPTSLAIIQNFAAAKKPIAAVCHGPCALINATTPTGTSLLQAATVTGFSNEEEEQVGMVAAMPFALETELNKVSGGGYVKADEPWGEKVVVSETVLGGALITGQNPASASGVARELLKAIGLGANR